VSHLDSAAQRVIGQGSQVRIALNTDVLFAFDKADLTPAAQAELRRVADRGRRPGQGRCPDHRPYR
jgi:outer membrane protein OmpA-like peptidoglycan-associated protein